MSRPRLLDLYSCAGGASVGYHRAGFDVVGVDHNHMARYPFEFHRSDALDYLADHGNDFDVIHASPPCQPFTAAKGLKTKIELPDQLAIVEEYTPPPGWRDMVGATRDMLDELGKPYVIENVPGAPLLDHIMLCGSHFGLLAPDTDGVTLQLRRHRLFESSMRLVSPGDCQHQRDMVTASVIGHGGGWSPAFRDRVDRPIGYVPHVDVCRRLLGIDWPMSKRELSESIPPAYTQYIGEQIMAEL